MSHSFDDAVPVSRQPVPAAKRTWTVPSITDEDVRNTAAKSTQPTEFPNTSGPAS